jgi:hypothetical protein
MSGLANKAADQAMDEPGSDSADVVDLRFALDTAAVRLTTGLPFRFAPDAIAGSFDDIERLEDAEAGRRVRLLAYADVIDDLAKTAPEFKALADALGELAGGRESALLQPVRLRRENKPNAYRDLAVYVAIAFFIAAGEIYADVIKESVLAFAQARDDFERNGLDPFDAIVAARDKFPAGGGIVVADRVLAELVGETRTGTESYADNLGEPWLPLRGRSWRQIRELLDKGLELLQRPRWQLIMLIEAGWRPDSGMTAWADEKRRILGKPAGAREAWAAAGVKPERERS